MRSSLLPRRALSVSAALRGLLFLALLVTLQEVSSLPHLLLMAHAHSSSPRPLHIGETLPLMVEIRTEKESSFWEAMLPQHWSSSSASSGGGGHHYHHNHLEPQDDTDTNGDSNGDAEPKNGTPGFMRSWTFGMKRKGAAAAAGTASGPSQDRQRHHRSSVSDVFDNDPDMYLIPQQRHSRVRRSLPPAFSPRVGVPTHPRLYPLGTWMEEAVARMGGSATSCSSQKAATSESVIALRFMVGEQPYRVKETTWLPLVICRPHTATTTDEKQQLWMGYEEVIEIHNASREEDDAVEEKHGGGSYRGSSSASREELVSRRYLQGLVFFFGYRSGVEVAVTSLRIRAIYTNVMPTTMSIQYRWDEHQAFHPHFAMRFISIWSGMLCVGMAIFFSYSRSSVVLRMVFAKNGDSQRLKVVHHHKD